MFLFTGLFEDTHMLYDMIRENEPSLAEMTTKAIKMLQRSDEGFALLVEGMFISLLNRDDIQSNQDVSSDYGFLFELGTDVP